MNCNIGSQYAAMYYVGEVLCEYWCTVIDVKGKDNHFINHDNHDIIMFKHI
jgi:hypothetical protein